MRERDVRDGDGERERRERNTHMRDTHDDALT